jgi:hypothetical protein
VYFGLVNIYRTYLQPSTLIDMDRLKIDSSGGLIRSFEVCNLVLIEAFNQ